MPSRTPQRECEDVDRAIHSLTQLYTAGRFPRSDHPCIEMAVQYARLRGLNVPDDLRQIYLKKRETGPPSLFGIEVSGVISAVNDIAAELGLKRRAGPLDACRGDLLFLCRRESFIGISLDGPREVLVLIEGKLACIESPRIHIAWDTAPARE